MKKFMFNYNGKNIEYTLEYKNRKTLSIQITRFGEVQVKVPLGIKETVVIEFVEKKGKWISEKIEKFNGKSKELMMRKYVKGENFLYLGQEYKLNIILHNKFKKNRVDLVGNELVILSKSYETEKIKKLLEKWYKEKAVEVFSEKVIKYLKYVKSQPASIKIKAQRKRWGSCSYKNDLIFNWRLIMAPKEVIEYVVVHEMCHINHKNHSKAFWSNVESIMSNYKNQEKWLEENGFKLYL